MLKKLDFIIFLFCKSIVFISVLAFSFLGYSEEYLFIEELLAYSLLLTPVFTFGLTTSYAHFNIVNDEQNHNRFYWSYSIVVLIVQIILVIGFCFVGWSGAVTVMLCIAVLTASRFVSQDYKNINNVSLSSLFDITGYIAITMYFVVVYFVNEQRFFLDVCFISILLLLGLILLGKRSGTRSVGKLPDHFSFIKFGLKALFIALISSAVLNIPRIVASWEYSASDAINFYESLRIGMVAVLVYQFIAIKYFRSLLLISRRYILLLALILYFIGILLSFILHFILQSTIYPTLDISVLAVHLSSFLLIVGFIEYFISRENLFIPYAILVVPTLFLLFTQLLDLVQYSILIALIYATLTVFIALQSRGWQHD